MPRRVFVSELSLGSLALPPAAAHHLVGVLRLTDGAAVEPFDAAGRRGVATLRVGPGGATLEVTEVLPAPEHPALVVASAVPKGDRADYLVEKLAELGVAAWVPLKTARSVVHPEGTSKMERWARIAQEAARQSHAPRVTEIRPLMPLAALEVGGAWFCSTAGGAIPAGEAPAPGLIVVGPEGGFTPEEEAALTARGAVAVTLGRTVLRVETACVVGAAMALGAHTNQVRSDA